MIAGSSALLVLGIGTCMAIGNRAEFFLLQRHRVLSGKTLRLLSALIMRLEQIHEQMRALAQLTMTLGWPQQRIWLFLQCGDGRLFLTS